MPVTAVENRYLQLVDRGVAGVLGSETAAERWCVDGVGRIREFALGQLLWSPSWGAWIVTGDAAGDYRARDEGVRLATFGYPLRDTGPAEDDPGLLVTVFEYGRLYARPNEVLAVTGEVYRRWAESVVGGHATLGHPTTVTTAPVRGVVARGIRPADQAPFGVYADGSTTAVLVGALESWYATLPAAELAVVGVPVTDIRATPDGGQEADFEGATVVARGGQVIRGPRRLEPPPPDPTPRNGGFEDGLTGWTSVPDTPGADPFARQPVPADSVNTAFVDVGRGPIGRLGGNYWHLPFPTGASGRALIAIIRDSGPGKTGVLRSDQFPIDLPYLLVKIGGYPGAGQVRLRLPPDQAALLPEPLPPDLPDADGLVLAWKTDPPGRVPMEQRSLDVSAVKGAAAVVEIVRQAPAPDIAANHGWLLVDDVVLADHVPPYDPPVLGWADIHSHPTSQAGFGGMLVGSNHGPVEDLDSCAPQHGHMHGPPFAGSLAGALEMDRPTGGAPNFDGWPAFDGMIHQQTHQEWIQRAYEGGQRLLVALVVHNPVLDTVARLPFDLRVPQSDVDTIEPQIAMLRQFATHYADWCGIATGPAEARALIRRDKLALVMGLETDSINGWIAQGALDGPEDEVRIRVRDYVEALWALGIRQINPVHLADSGVGAHAVYDDMFLLSSWWQRGVSVDLADGWLDPHTGQPRPAHEQVLYRAFGSKPNAGPLGVPLSSLFKGLGAQYFRLLLDKIQQGVIQPPVPHSPLLVDYSSVSRQARDERVDHGHINAHGLTPNGHLVLEELHRRGFVIDLDHMSEHTVLDVLDLPALRDTPFVAAHTSMRELARRPDDPRFRPEDADDPRWSQRDWGTANPHAWPNESSKTRSQVRTVRDSNGIAGPITHTPTGTRTHRGRHRGAVANDCFGSSKSWAQQYLSFLDQMDGAPTGLGTDINCLCEQLAPRFGPMAGWGLSGDPEHERGEPDYPNYAEPPAMTLRRLQVAAQQGGVRYDSPPAYFGPNRYRRHGASDPGEEVAWLAIALLSVGIPPGGLLRPDAGDGWSVIATRALAVVAGYNGTPGVDITLPGTDARAGAALFGRVAPIDAELTDPVTGRPTAFATFLASLRRAETLWPRAMGFASSAPPMRRCATGDGREWDVNLDGVAHYGLFPDVLQDLTNVGFPVEARSSLFGSAERYLQVWAASAP